MQSTGASNSDAVGASLSSASNKLMDNRAKRLRRKVRKLQAREQASATVTHLEDTEKDIEPRSESTVIIEGAKNQVDTPPTSTEIATLETNDHVSKSQPQDKGSKKKSKANKSHRHEKPIENSKLDVANDTSVHVDKSQEDQDVKPSTTAAGIIAASSEQYESKSSHKRGKRTKGRNKKGEKVQSDKLAQIDEGDVAEPVIEEASLPSNKVVPTSDDLVQKGDHTTDSELHDRTLQSKPTATNTPLSSRVSRMAPVVLPRLLFLPSQFTKNSDHSIIESSSEKPAKIARDFAREIAQMDRDLKRVNKKQKRIRNRNRNKSGNGNAEMNDNSTDMTALETASVQSATNQTLPNKPAATLTYNQWKRLPKSKRYALITFKEKLAIHAIESIPQILIQSSQIAAASATSLPLINRMASSFTRTMELARIEAEKGVFNSSGQEEKTSIDHIDIMSVVEIENFVAGIQEVMDPDEGGRVVMRRYWRLIGLKESECGVGGILAADLKEEKSVGGPSFKLKGEIVGVEGLLLCEAKVDEAGVSLRREWNAEE